MRASKIRAHGWSTDDPERAAFFAEGPHCASVQNQMNVFSDAPEMMAVCEGPDLASISRGPLAMGLLPGKYKADSRLAGDDVRGENAPSWMQYFKENPILSPREVVHHPQDLDCRWAELGSGSPGLALGAQRQDGANPRFSHRGTGGGERQGDGIWATQRDADA